MSLLRVWAVYVVEEVEGVEVGTEATKQDNDLGFLALKLEEILRRSCFLFAPTEYSNHFVHSQI